MSGAEILKNLEIGGFSAVFMICCFGLYKLILAKGFASKCGMFSLDLRSASTRQKEIANLHELEMRKLEIEELRANAELLKYQNNYKDNEYSSYSKTGQSSPIKEIERYGVGRESSAP